MGRGTWAAGSDAGRGAEHHPGFAGFSPWQWAGNTTFHS